MQTARHQTPFTATRWPINGPIIGIAAAAIRLLLCWQERAAQRRRLSELDDRALKDIGLSRADAAGESAKTFWRA
jgi:uncharacterized protein YjiS (DUF1127 family)